jgi:alpha-glucosidase
VEIEKEPSFRIIFKNKNGEVINEDVKGDCFGTTFTGDKVSVYKKLQEGERFTGMGEALGNLDRRGTGITLNNTDTYKYGDPRLPMYTSIPFYIGLHHQQVYGLFYNNSYKSFFNFGLSTPGITSVNFEGGDADYFFMYDISVAKIIAHYTALTGRMQLPPLWSLGYHQSRCSYYPQQKVEWLAQTFRNKKIPLDCIVLDADYQQGYQPFRVNKDRFPDMAGLAASLATMNIELTASVYPGVKIDSTYDSYNDGLKNDVFVKYADGSLFETAIAPLQIYLPDYTNAKTRTWWKNKMKWMEDNGIHGYWNDMNEPAIGGSYLPDNLLFDFDGHKANALEAKNVYGFQMARSSYEAAIQNGKGKRPFILTRSGFAGVQRYSAVWSGDNTASDEGLLSGVLLNNQMGLSGMPFVGPDLGGYIGDGTKDLFKRWIEVGTFSPFMRNHKEFNASANEPWSYGEEAEAIAKTYIGFRYRLMPYIYSAFYNAAQTGMPVARSLSINYPFNDKVYDNIYQYQFLFGDALLVAPVTTQEKVKKILLPAGNWYNINTDEKIEGDTELAKEYPIYQLPLYAKESAIIPLQKLIQSTKETPNDTLILHIFNGKQANHFVYYEDEGNNFDYTQGKFYKKTIQFDPVNKKIVLQAKEGNFVSNYKKIALILHGFDNNLQAVMLNGRNEILKDCSVKILDALENLADYYDSSYYQSLRNAEPVMHQKMIVIDNAEQEINISL